ncbi:endo-1,3-1,4-beta-D-glucanase-like protein, partial [Trifolium pratense]
MLTDLYTYLVERSSTTTFMTLLLNEAFEDTKPVIEALKHKGVLSIGAASFCWGAKVVVELAKSRLIQAAVLLHPSFITLDDIKGISIPIAVLGAEIDKYCPPELLKQFEQILTAELGDECYVKLFPEVLHGWTIRYNIEDAMAAKAADKSHRILLEWFAKHIVPFLFVLCYSTVLLSTLL